MYTKCVDDGLPYLQHEYIKYLVVKKVVKFNDGCVVFFCNRILLINFHLKETYRFLYSKLTMSCHALKLALHSVALFSSLVVDNNRSNTRMTYVRNIFENVLITLTYT